MTANEARDWCDQGDANFVIGGVFITKEVVSGYNQYVPIYRVNEDFFHLRYVNGYPVVDYGNPVNKEEYL